MKSLKRRVVFNYTIVILVTIIFLEILLAVFIRQYYYGNITQILKEKVAVTTEFYEKYLVYEEFDYKSQYIIENFSIDERAEIQIIDLSGKVVNSSSGFSMEKPISTADFGKALLGDIGTWRYKDQDTGEELIAVSGPLINRQGFDGVLRYVTSIEETNRVVKRIILQAVFLGAIVLILVVLLSMLLAESIIKPIKELKTVSEKIADGDLKARVEIRKNDEIGELGRTFNYMAKELMKTSQMKNDFISSISHEIRTPLTSIKGWCETMLMGKLDDEKEIREELMIISKEANRLSDMVENLLDFSKLEAGRIVLSKEKVDINYLIMDVAKQFYPKAMKKTIRLETSLDQSLTYVEGDENRLRQVLINLIDNSIKFTETGGRISVGSEKRGEKVSVFVKDNGQGIDQKDLEHITEKFFKGNMKSQGSGLGLAITNEIVELHGGKMEIESVLEKGTKISVIL